MELSYLLVKNKKKKIKITGSVFILCIDFCICRCIYRIEEQITNVWLSWSYRVVLLLYKKTDKV